MISEWMGYPFFENQVVNHFDTYSESPDAMSRRVIIKIPSHPGHHGGKSWKILIKSNRGHLSVKMGHLPIFLGDRRLKGVPFWMG
jgi:hypothetical protein